MQIDPKDIQPGCILLFKRDPQDKVAGALSLLIKCFYRSWDRWGWHMAIITGRNASNTDWDVLEATWPVSRINQLSVMGEYRVYEWLDDKPCQGAIDEFVKDHIGLPYDVKKYVFIIACGLLNHVFKINLGRWDDESYLCWEVPEEFVEWMGKPFTKKNETLLLPDIQRLLEG
jgi:hypothetical protein